MPFIQGALPEDDNTIPTTFGGDSDDNLNSDNSSDNGVFALCLNDDEGKVEAPDTIDTGVMQRLLSPTPDRSPSQDDDDNTTGKGQKRAREEDDEDDEGEESAEASDDDGSDSGNESAVASDDEDDKGDKSVEASDDDDEDDESEVSASDDDTKVAELMTKEYDTRNLPKTEVPDTEHKKKVAMNRQTLEQTRNVLQRLSTEKQQQPASSTLQRKLQQVREGGLANARTFGLEGNAKKKAAAKKQQAKRRRVVSKTGTIEPEPNSRAAIKAELVTIRTGLENAMENADKYEEGKDRKTFVRQAEATARSKVRVVPTKRFDKKYAHLADWKSDPEILAKFAATFEKYCAFVGVKLEDHHDKGPFMTREERRMRHGSDRPTKKRQSKKAASSDDEARDELKSPGSSSHTSNKKAKARSQKPTSNKVTFSTEEAASAQFLDTLKAQLEAANAANAALNATIAAQQKTIGNLTTLLTQAMAQ